MAPARILAREPQHQLPHLGRQARRPRWPGGCRHFRRTSARCQRSSVRGVTRSTPRDERGRWHAAAASRARSAVRSFGRATWRRRISSSCRSTSSFDVFHIQAATATNKRAQQSPNGEVEEGEGHAADPPSPLAPKPRHDIGALQLFASTYVDEIATAQRHGGKAAVREKLVSLTLSERRVLREALAETELV